MKRKIVIKVPMHKDKDKSKAMKIVVAEEGVISVSIGKENDVLEVIGEGVDSVCLAKSLRKKFCFADIVSVAEVKPPAPPSPEKCLLQPCFYPPTPLYEWQYYDRGPTNNCSIM
ncbi:heavy metal-associated isoprenylated plant protein 47-like [Salvia miltiorrhiza]|uniref:heavy metal-associated isoprenylated plant protein 47-like n=1 Tax=Salvia miltiorrhiza TaxID=226208 RepID=UPI0025AD616B|nr:heavy metal-associated isoprenylated plant protein 47-like [Salvia miltiorrhiza]